MCVSDSKRKSELNQQKVKLLQAHRFSLMDLKRVNTIPQRYKDIVFGFIKKAQLLFPHDNCYYNIVDLIMHLILLYFYAIFESSILNEEEKDQLLSLFKKYDKEIVLYPWKIIFDSKKDTICRDNFIEKVHGKTNVLLLIRLKGECVIGGYTKTGWIEEENSDKDAFIFYLKSPGNYNPFISNIKQDDKSMYDDAVGYCGAYCGFGAVSWIIYFNSTHFEMQSIHSAPNYDDFPSDHGNDLLAGSFDYDHLHIEQVQLEAFQIEM